MALFVPQESDDTVSCAYAAGAQASRVRGFTAACGAGVVGWVAANRRIAVNSEPALDLGSGATAPDPPLLSMIALPLVHEGTLRAVLALYAGTTNAFTEDQGRLLELLAPKLAASLSLVSAAGRASDRPRRERRARADLKVFQPRASGIA
jgi:GAF domain-containing protein